jgi:K+-sensing histidine kinase KdpD
VKLLALHGDTQLIQPSAKKLMKRLLSSYQKFFNQQDQNPMLTLSESVLAGLIDSDMIGMALHNHKHEIVWTNYTFMRMVNRKNVPLPEVFSLTALTPKDHQPADSAAYKSLTKPGTSKPYEKSLISLDGKHLEVLVSHTRLIAKKKTFLSLFLDISKSKRLEQLKNDFISITSHELKTPLTSMSAYTQMMQKSQAGTDFGDYLTKMIHLIDRQNALINDLLDLSKIESETFELLWEKVNITKATSQIVEDFLVKFPLRKVVMGQCDMKHVYGDRQRILQVLTNLMSNAIKYSPENTPIMVEFRPNGNFLEISVKDRGMGIKKAERKRLFKRYSRIHAGNIQGLGLGLFIAKKIVEQHGGSIGVRSNKPKGSDFFFTLPTKQSNTLH